MNINLNKITFIIVTFKSEKIINGCLKTLPKDSHKIVIDNSKNINLKNEIESKYDNIEVILSENNGMGTGNNIGLKRCKTQYAFILNPDTRLHESTIPNIIESAKLINDFAILSPLNSDLKYPNYKISNNYQKINDNIISVDYLDGFSMLINLQRYKNTNFFDENFFLFLENDDLCRRTKKNKENIYIIKNSLIDHLGFSSSDQSSSQEMEYLRNWHWMWSKFYYNKKHYGFMFALTKVLPNFFSAITKILIYFLLLNSYRRKIYQSRVSGIFNSIIGKNSWFRIDN